MTKSILNVVNYVSMLLLVVFIGLYSYAWIFDPDLDPPSFHISVCSVHMTVTKHWGGKIIFFNQEAPYTGGVYALTGDQTVKAKGCDGFGIYYRLITDTKTTDSWWTLMFSFWYPIFIFGILPTVFVVKSMNFTRQP